MKIDISKMYGFNDQNDFHFETEKRHSFIYGINGSGKSSIAKALTHLVNGSSYLKHFPFDSNTYSINFKFEDIDLKLSDQNVLDQNDVHIIKKRIYIFNKEYVKNNISVSNSTGGKIEIGSRINERTQLLNEKSKIISDAVMSFKTSGKNCDNFPSKISDFKNGVVSDMYGKSEEKHETSLISLNQIVDLQELDLNVFDLYSANIDAIKKFDTEILELSQEILDGIKESMETFNYNIDNTEDRLFYNSLIRFLNSNDEKKLVCPVCLESSIDVQGVLEAITNVLNTKITNARTSKIHLLSESINEQSYFGRMCHILLNQLLKNIYNSEMIVKFHKEFTDYWNNYEQYILNFLDFNLINDELIESIQIKNGMIEVINQENRNLQQHEFTIIFDNTLRILFPDGYLTTKIDTFNNIPGIRIDINQRSKKGMQIESLFTDILSESQKTRLSLAFYFAVVLYRIPSQKITENVLCVFDDPVDSYDSLSKYYISRTIYEFITNKGIFKTKYNLSNIHSLILSHSVEYFRLYDSNLLSFEKEECEYFVLTKQEVRNIRNDNIFVLQGDYNILETFVKKETVNIKEFISVLPILRELTKTSSNVLNIGPLQVCDQPVNELNEYLSRDVIHGFGNSVTLMDVVIKVTSFVELEVTGLESIDTSVSFTEYLKSIILLISIDGVEFYDSIILKNLYAIYIRSYYDNLLCSEIKNKISKYSQKSLEEIQHELRSMQQKIGCLFRCGDDESRVLVRYVAKIKPMFNDFAHSAGIFLTPLLDVELSLLRKLFDEVNKDI